MKHSTSDSLEQSTILQADIEQIWALIEPFDFDIIDSVTKVEAHSGVLGSVGSVLLVTLANNVTQFIRITEMSRVTHKASWVVVASPESGVVQEVHTIELLPVTTASHTYMRYSMEFHEHVSLKGFMHHQARVGDVFFDFKQHVSMNDESSTWPCSLCTYINEAGALLCGGCENRHWEKYHLERVRVPWQEASNYPSWESVPFTLDRHTWRVVIFPRGTNSGRDWQLSMFLQFLKPEQPSDNPEQPVANISDSYYCDFLLGVLHPQEVNTKLSRENQSKLCSSDFKFTRQNYDQGFEQVLKLTKIPYFLDAQGDLILLVGVRRLPEKD